MYAASTLLIHKPKTWILINVHTCGRALTHSQMCGCQHTSLLSHPQTHNQLLDGWWLSVTGSPWLELCSSGACTGSHTQPRKDCNRNNPLSSWLITIKLYVCVCLCLVHWSIHHLITPITPDRGCSHSMATQAPPVLVKTQLIPQGLCASSSQDL